MANLNKIEDPSFLIRGRRPAEDLPPRAIDGADEAAVEAAAAGAPVAPDAHDHHIGRGADARVICASGKAVTSSTLGVQSP